MQTSLTERQIALFSYTPEQQKAFPYLGVYMTRVAPHIDEIMLSPGSRVRFMLAGLFLTYRACNHQGVSMTTRMDSMQLREDHASRLAEFAKATGIEIKSTGHYLQLIGFSKFRWFILLFFGVGRGLASFVLNGKLPKSPDA